MKVLVIDPNGNGLDFAMRAQADDHEVRLAIPDNEKNRFIGQGLAEVVRDHRPSMAWADLIFLTDNTKHMRDTDAARKAGKVVIGPTAETAKWELDRDVGMEVLRKHGIPVPPYREFSSYDKAIAYVKKHRDARFVSKPSGDADKALSYCAKSASDMVYMLERWKQNDKLKSAPFILQEFIDGIEMAVGGWIGPGGFNTGWCENFEFKKLMNDDLGCATGEQGTVLRYVKTSKLADKCLKPLQDTLVAAGYTGYIDVNTIVEEDGTVWPLEFTMRPGWPTFNIQQALHDGDSVQWLMDLAEGIDAKNLRYDEVAIGVVLSVPDYPYSHLTKKEVSGIPIYGLTQALWRHVHPCEMMLAEVPDQQSLAVVPAPATAGDYVLVMTATGDTVRAARDTAYRRLKKLTVPNSPMYRTDIGNRLAKQLPMLQAKGFARQMAFSNPPDSSPTSSASRSSRPAS